MRSIPQTLLLCGLAALAVLAPGAVRSQTSSASLTGLVRTESGDPVRDAVVSARSASNGQVRTTVTDERGRYRLDSLAPGEWLAMARVPDGAISEARAVELRLQQTVVLDYTVGTGYAETVTVKAEAPLVDPTESGGSLRVSGKQADTLPVAGRNMTDLALLDSSVRQSAPGGYFGERGAVFTVNGQSARSNSFLVDGMDNNDQFSGTTVNSFFSQQVIEEFVLMTHQFAPEFGRASGGVMNVVTRRGTNEFGIQGFTQGSRGEWGGENSFLGGLPGDAQANRSFQAGLNFGGPLRKDKASYFVAYEHIDADAVVPFTGIDRNGVQGGLLAAPSRDDNLFARVDFNLGANKTLMLRMTGNNASADGLNVGGISTPDAGFDIEEQDLQLAATFNYVISPRLLSESRLLTSVSRFDQQARSVATGVTRPSGVFGGNPLAAQQRDTDVLQLVQNFTLTRGSHTIKAGIDVLRSQTDIDARFNPAGGLIYNEDAALQTGDCDGFFTVFEVFGADEDGRLYCPGDPNGADDDLDGDTDEKADLDSYPVVFTLIDGDASATQRDTQFSLFAQDRWQISPAWMVFYGLRYDLSTYVLPDDFAVESSIPNGGASRDTDNLAPRFSFTFNPFHDSRMLLRGGAGVFYDKLVLAFPAAAAVTSGTSIGFFFPQGFGVPTTEDYIEENGVDAIPVGQLDSVTLRFSTSPDLETPYTVQYSLGFEMRTGRTSAFRADLIRSRGYNQPLMRDLNPVVCVPADPGDPVNFDCPTLPEHRDPTTGSIAAITTDGSSWYDGLDLKWQIQTERNWFQVGYTLSKSEDLGSDPLKNGITLPWNSDDLESERGRSDNDRRHRIVLSGDVPLHVAGLRLSGVAQYATGLPYNVVIGKDENLDGFQNERPEGVDRNAGKNASLEAINAIRFDEGLEAVGGLEEPDFRQVDLRLYWPIAGQDVGGQIFLQVFNVFNAQNIGLIEGRVVSGNFGRAIGLAGPPRTFEIGFQFGF
jgi:hypothetical protein